MRAAAALEHPHLPLSALAPIGQLQRGVAAHQQQGEGVVPPGWRRLVGRFQRGDGLLPAAAGAHAAPPVDHGAAGGGDQPRPRVAGDPPAKPAST
jgi:hypothetical protein